jgi:hypothetical protein
MVSCCSIGSTNLPAISAEPTADGDEAVPSGKEHIDEISEHQGRHSAGNTNAEFVEQGPAGYPEQAAIVGGAK